MAFKKVKKKDRKDKRDKRDRKDKENEYPLKKRKWTPVFEATVKEVDFKDVRLLSKFVTERGKILPRKITGLNSQQQKMVANGIKRARQMSLLPFLSYGS